MTFFFVKTFALLDPMMTSLTDKQIVGELGWVMQAMYDHTPDKKLCVHWRPPYGQSIPASAVIKKGKKKMHGTLCNGALINPIHSRRPR